MKKLTNLIISLLLAASIIGCGDNILSTTNNSTPSSNTSPPANNGSNTSPPANNGSNTSPPITEELGLTKINANALASRYYDQEMNVIKPRLSEGWNKTAGDPFFTADGQTMKFKKFTVGSKPAGGWSVYISMHGGGGAPASTNDGQWNNQVYMMGGDPGYVRYGSLSEGLMIVPRAPVNEWNMWFQQPMNKLIDDVIRAATLFGEINPNKIYIMGYSAGGDGTFRLASRLSDHWAGASMSAGHPGEVDPITLRNIPFALNMGGQDDSFNRNGLAREWKTKLADLKANDNLGGYDHLVSIFEDKPHWMDYLDDVGIKFIRDKVRNPYPKRVIWLQNSFGPTQYFYWLGVGQVDLVGENYNNLNKKIDVEVRDGNSIHILSNYATELKLYLNDNIVDLDQNVKIYVNGNKVFDKKVLRRDLIIQKTAKERLDVSYVFSAELVVKNNEVVVIKE